MKSNPTVFSDRFACGVAVALAFLALSSSLFGQRLPTSVVPTHYTLKLSPDLKAATFSGEEAIDVNIAAPTRSITLNAIEIAFQSVTITSDGPEQTGTVSLDSEKQQATFMFPETIPAGHASIKIHYTGILNNELRGFYLSKTARRNYAVTQFEATDARRAFPCFDEPAFKATYDISLVIDAADSAISNTPIVGDTRGPGIGKHTLVFGTTPKMSTYLVAFLVGDFECTGARVDDVDIRVCATPDKVALTPFALDVAKFALHYYDDYFGIHYPLKKLDLIGVPDFEAGAMENFGAITFRETDLLIDPKTAPISAQRNAAIDVTHEMAHQWFGDLVTMQWWDNIWLNEGFATWMENKPVAAMHPEWNMPEVVASNEQDTLDIDAQPTTRAIRARADTPDEIDEMFDSIAYGKASDVLLTVENYLGEETFRKGVQAYLKAHEYANATAEDFWNAQTEVSHKPVDKIMESLIAQPGEPILTFGQVANGIISVEQKRFFLSPSIHPDQKQKWTLPVCFTGEGIPCDLLTPKESGLHLPMGPLIFANAGGKGYYRNAYTPAQYAALAAQAASLLTPPEQISLLGDEWALTHSNRVPIGEYLDLVSALKSDSNAEVFSSAAGKIAIIADKIASTKEERDELAAWIRRNYASEYDKLGPPATGDSPNRRELRAQLLGLLSDQGNDTEIQDPVRKIASQFLADPASLDPALGQAALKAAAQNGDAEIFDRLQKMYESSADPAVQENALRLLVQFRDHALLERGLEYSISNKVRNQDAAIQLRNGLRSPENRDQVWRFIKMHWGAVQASLTTDLGALMVSGTGSFCTDAARDDVKSFFATHPVPASSVALKHALENIDGCVELRRLQEPNLRKWLAGQGGS
ncbi:MAG TPA: M1 family metallopeptidase [Terracidiphilus sp.]|jgi:aminopeptidase N/puromycin-sensitive aminopeptidase